MFLAVDYLDGAILIPDSHVAGVISGANGINPGIQMQQQGLLEGGKNVALTGRVYVQADAAFGAIKPGDLLTTSSTPGHAMKVSNHNKAQGAILGKAMTGLKSGRGSVLVLVTFGVFSPVLNIRKKPARCRKLRLSQADLR